MKAIILAALLGFGVPSGESYIKDASTALAAGEYEQSIELFENALATNDLPQDLRVAALMDEAHAYHLLGRPKDAIQKFSSVIAIAPGHAQAYVGRAGAYFLDGEIDKAVDDYNHVLQLTQSDNPLRSTALVGRAGGYFRENKIDLSLADYASALRIDPKDELPRFLRGTVYWRIGRF
ncbi:MAG TPA: tetratricopeptide repeat protein, partial [Rhizomicrobium sp.]